MGRTVITTETVDAMVRDGVSTHQVAAGTIVTDAAKERARDRGVRLIPAGATATPPVEDAALAARVRSGVIARLGQVPAGLDAAIARVLSQP